MQYSGNPGNQFELDRFSLNSDENSSNPSELDRVNLNANEWNLNNSSRNLGEIGNKIISSGEGLRANPSLGQIINLEMPPDASVEERILASSNNNSSVKSASRFSLGPDEKIDKQTLAAVKNTIGEFNETGDASRFYDTIRDERGENK